MNTGDTKDDVDFSFRFSVESGAMVTWTFHVAKKIPNDQLKQLNDIAWLIWQDRAKTLKLDVGNIKYYIIPDISNTPCRKVIEKVSGVDDYQKISLPRPGKLTR